MVRKDIIKRIQKWRREGDDVVVSAEFRFYYPCFKMLDWMVTSLELDRMTYIAASGYLLRFIKSDYWKLRISVPGITCAIISVGSTLGNRYVSIGKLSKFTGMCERVLSDYVWMINDMLKFKEGLNE